MTTPKLKRDWVGLTVRTKVELKTRGGSIFPAGVDMKVTRNHGGLDLTYEAACENCQMRHRHTIRGVSEHEVEIVG